jgi:hypothetical protein
MATVAFGVPAETKVMKVMVPIETVTFSRSAAGAYVKVLKFAPSIRPECAAWTGRDSTLPAFDLAWLRNVWKPGYFVSRRQRAAPLSVVAGSGHTRGCRDMRIVAEKRSKVKNRK